MTAALAGVSACVFDAYGTLLDVGAAARKCQDRLGTLTDSLTALWRQRQVEYTWLRTLMNDYADFWAVTGEALDFAMAAHNLDDPGLRARLMETYLRLDAYPDSRPTLETLHGRGMKTAILSNGSPTMLAAAIDSGHLRQSLDAVLSVDSLQLYKPVPAVYQLACDHLHLEPQRIAFVSSNGWDVAGSAHFGFQTIWLNRAGGPSERLPGKPVAVITSLTELPPLLS